MKFFSYKKKLLTSNFLRKIYPNMKKVQKGQKQGSFII